MSEERLGTKVRNRSSAWIPEELGEINVMIAAAIREVAEMKAPVLSDEQFALLQDKAVAVITAAVQEHFAVQSFSKKHKN
jgi:hypothetical protein